MMMEQGALVIQAHPFREKFNIGPIDHIHLYPSAVHGVEILNVERPKFENDMAEHYANSYGLIPFAGSDNHVAGARRNWQVYSLKCLCVTYMILWNEQKRAKLKSLLLKIL